MERDPEAVQFMRQASRKVASLDVPISSHDSLTYADVIPDESLPAHDEELVETEEQQEHLQEVAALLSHLRAREQQVIRLHFGLGGEQACTLAEIGRLIGLSRERVRQIQAEALAKLRRCSCSASLKTDEQQDAS
jgi:RNA polymerase primary sigma factor